MGVPTRHAELRGDAAGPRRDPRQRTTPAASTCKASKSGDYPAQQEFTPPAGTPVSFARGWAYIDASYRGSKFRFVTTHLEVESFPTVQEAQAQEFLAGPARTTGAVIAVGDFNSDAEPAPGDVNTTTYTDLTRYWFRDAWAVNRGANGDTCCQNSTLSNPTSQLHTRIDLVLIHGDVRSRSAKVVDDQPISDTPPLWASDHAGVVADAQPVRPGHIEPRHIGRDTGLTATSHALGKVDDTTTPRRRHPCPV